MHCAPRMRLSEQRLPSVDNPIDLELLPQMSQGEGCHCVSLSYRPLEEGAHPGGQSRRVTGGNYYPGPIVSDEFLDTPNGCC